MYRWENDGKIMGKGVPAGRRPTNRPLVQPANAQTTRPQEATRGGASKP